MKHETKNSKIEIPGKYIFFWNVYICVRVGVHLGIKILLFDNMTVNINWENDKHQMMMGKKHFDYPWILAPSNKRGCTLICNVKPSQPKLAKYTSTVYRLQLVTTSPLRASKNGFKMYILMIWESECRVVIYIQLMYILQV